MTGYGLDDPVKVEHCPTVTLRGVIVSDLDRIIAESNMPMMSGSIPAAIAQQLKQVVAAWPNVHVWGKKIGEDAVAEQNYAGRRVEVVFDYDLDHRIGGEVVVDPPNAPLTIRLDDGRHVLSTQCQFRLMPRDR